MSKAVWLPWHNSFNAFVNFVLFFEMFKFSIKEDEMPKLLYLIALIIFLILQEEPAFCGATRTMSFQISVTIPEHVMLNNDLNAAPPASTPFQLVQTQTVIRNNRTISLTSIVVP